MLRQRPANGALTPATRAAGATCALRLAITIATALLLACGAPPSKATPPVQDCRGGKVWHQEDSVRFRGCERIEGNLALGGALQTAEDFAALRIVAGDLDLGPSYQLDNLAALSGLERVEGSVRLQNNMRLGGLFLGALEYIGGALQVLGNTQLRTLSLHHTAEIGGALSIGEANRVLQRVDLSALRKLGGATLQIDWQKDRPEAVLRAPLY